MSPALPTLPGLRDHWYIACRSARLKGRPLARTLLGTPLVLFRGAGGRAVALLDRCPHRNAPLSRGRMAGPHLACPYHGWQFDAQGACRAVPGLSPDEVAEHPSRSARAFAVLEQDGFVWVHWDVDPRVAAPDHAPARLAHLGEPGYSAFVGETTVEAALPDALENFLDGAHTHFVHGGLVRREGRRRDVTAIVLRTPSGVEARYPDEGQQSGLIARLFGADVDDVVGRFCLPSTAQLEYRAGGRLKLLITLCFTPENDERLRLYAVVVGRAPPLLRWLAVPLIQLLFLKALRQDRRILELQSANLRSFGGPRYVHTALDLLGPDIVRLLKQGPATAGEPVAEKRVRLRM